MALVWDKALFDSLYRAPSWQYGIQDHRLPMFNYHWYASRFFVDAIVKRYQSLPGFNSLSDIAIIGGGFGWVAEALVQLGKNVVVIDTSQYILDNKDTSEEPELRECIIAAGMDPDALPVFMGPDWNTPVNPWQFWLRPDGKRTSVPILGEDLSTQASRKAVRQALGNNIDAIVTEYAIESVESGDDAASLAIIERCEQLRPNPSCNVIHLTVTGNVGEILNSKPLEDWRALLDANGYTDHYVVSSWGLL